ncbi:MAG: sugar kinase [Proteobacteria bacterium]|nr:sugar kinase [Pseudomonadota bacterium]
MSATLDLLAFGEAMIEFNQARRDDPHAYTQGFGGDTSNAAIAAARLGASVGYATRIGGDAFGRWLVGLWQAEGVDTRGVAVDADAPTGAYFVSHGAAGHEFSYLRSGSAATRMRPDNLPLDVLRATRVLHLSGISQAISPSACDAAFAAIDVARAAGARIAYDTNLRLKLWPLARASAVIRATIARADWLLPSLDDVRTIYGLDAPDALIDAMLADGARAIVLKMGADGAIVVADGARVRIEPHRVATVDATGAGDCFDGAFLARVAAGDAVVDAARYANAAAALATTGYSAVAPLPRDAAVRALLRRAA